MSDTPTLRLIPSSRTTETAYRVTVTTAAYPDSRQLDYIVAAPNADNAIDTAYCIHAFSGGGVAIDFHVVQ